MGTNLMQQHGTIGGARSVFVKLSGNKNELVFPTHGGFLKNPFKTGGKIFAGDLIEYRTDANGENPELFLLKVFKVVAVAGTTVDLKKDGFSHVPSVGDKLMVAPSDVNTSGTTATVTAVVPTADAYKVTLSAALGSAGDILVEAGEDGKMLVKNPNTFAPCDYDLLYAPAANAASFEGARYFLTPVLHGIAYECKMTAVPDCVKAFNKSRVNGWFEL